jgi:hypothetical protein
MNVGKLHPDQFQYILDFYTRLKSLDHVLNAQHSTNDVAHILLAVLKDIHYQQNFVTRLSAS